MAVVRPSGELDLASADALRRQLHEALAEAPELLVLDLSDVSFLDSSGIAVIVSVFKAQRDRGARLHVVNPQPTVRRALELVGLGMLLIPPAG